ncbi:MAG: hypothetical protein EXR75_03005 [Myxococcales bacterium]|nr:hypothetical protein [Myxococcales bacterium]
MRTGRSPIVKLAPRRHASPCRAPVTLALVFGAITFTCTPHLPTPPDGPHAGDAPLIVPYPPPVARVELIPPRRRQEAVWLDGAWAWRVDRWSWTRGKWALVPEPGAYYAPPMTVRRRNGELFHFAGQWHRADTSPILEARAPATE